MKKYIALANLNDEEIRKRELENGYITYKTLSERVGDMVLCNKMASHYGYEMNLENGNDYNEETEEYTEIYQYYIISDNGASYLKSVSSEIVFYDSDLDIYVWGITHYGTSWDYVFTDIKATENILGGKNNE